MFTELAFASNLAVLLIALSGIFLILQQQAVALRLFLGGVLIAGLAGAAGHLARGHDAHLIGLLSAIAAAGIVTAVLFRAWRLAFGIMVAAALAVAGVYVIAPFLAPFLIELKHHWLLALALVTAPFAAAAVAFVWLRALRERLLTIGAARTFERFLVRLLDHLIGDRNMRVRRDRHIGEFSTTRRAHHGRGPNRI